MTSTPIRPSSSFEARLAQGYMRAEENALAVEWADRALEGAERLDMVPVIAEGMITKATAMGSMGRMRESEALLAGALSFADENDLAASQMRAHLNLSNSMWITDPRRGLKVARTGIDHCAPPRRSPLVCPPDEQRHRLRHSYG